MHNKKIWVTGMIWVLVMLLSTSACLRRESVPSPGTPISIPTGLASGTATPLLDLTETMTIISQPSPTPTQPAEPWPECSPPCWRGIVPGQTSYEDVTNMLKSYPDVEIGTTTLRKDGAWWRFDFLDASSDSWASEFTSHMEGSNGVVTNIDLYLKQLQPLQEIVERFGTPEQVLTRMTGGTEMLWREAVLFYPEIGVTFYVVLGFPNSEGQLFIEPSDWVFGVEYFEPRTMQELKETRGGATSAYAYKDYLQDWTGFGPIEIHPDLRDRR